MTMQKMNAKQCWTPNTRDSIADVDVKQGDEINVIKRSCGKMYIGVKGLKMDQTRCRVIEGLSEDQVAVKNIKIATDSSLDDYTEVPADWLE